MANVYPVENAKEGIIRSLAGSKSWLMQLESKADVRGLDANINVGTNNYTVIDQATANAIVDKSSTSVVADSGKRHTVSATTKTFYQPVKYHDFEVTAMLQNDTLGATVQKDIKVQTDAVLLSITKALIEGLSDGTLTKTVSLGTGMTNFTAGTEANQIKNMEKFGSVLGSVAADNNGNLPDWVVAHPTAWGNISGYAQNANARVTPNPNGETTFFVRGVPFHSVGIGTSTKWGAASKPCVFMGCDRHIIFAIRNVVGGEYLELQSATGLWTLPILIEATYGLDFTSSTGLALGIGEVVNPAT